MGLRRKQNKRGQMIMINLLFLFMTIAVTVALIPALKVMLNMAQQSDGLNCPGYAYLGDPDATLSYNETLATNTLACLAINLYLPYIILAILIGGVSRMLLGNMAG